MRNVINALAAIMCIALINAPAYAEDVECVSEQCAGWHVSYEGNIGADYVMVKFANESGTTAFKITPIVNFYDYFGNFVGRIQERYDGPIHERIFIRARVPSRAFKIKAEIYYKLQYE